MSVSDRHGGGLTVQRVLGDDLDKLERLIVLSSRPDLSPACEALESRELRLAECVPFDTPPSRFSAEYLQYAVTRGIGALARHRTPATTYARQAWYTRYLLDELDWDDKTLLSVPQTPLCVTIVNQMCRRRRFRYIAWIMDDHVLRYRPVGGFVYPRGFEAQFARYLRGADDVLVISTEMARFYQQKFGVESDVLFGPADPSGEPVWASPSRDALRFCYFGSIGDWQRDGLRELIRVLSFIPAELDIYTFHDVPSSWRRASVRVIPPIPADQVVPTMRGYSAAVISASFRDEHRPRVDLNISTKLSECLASGTVTLFVGPARAAASRFIEQKACGLQIEHFGSAELDRLRGLREPENRRPILKRARDVASTETSTAAMRGVWRAALERLEEGLREPAATAFGA